jgi:small-conductance mechanosensitive channel
MVSLFLGAIYNGITEKTREVFQTYMSPEKLTNYTGDILKIVFIIVAMIISIRLMNMVVDRFFDQKAKFKLIGEQKKVDTLRGIIKSILRYGIYFIAFTPILETVGIRVSSLIAAAGIGGLAIGFGAQNLVRDVITGFFILLEDQFQVGDYIEVVDKSGIVEDITLRVTKLKDFNGDLHIIPNGIIDKVTNKSRDNMRALVEVGISYKENVDKIIDVLENICKEMAKKNDKIVEGPTVLGITNLGESGIIISIDAKTLPMEQWGIERELRKRIKDQFDKIGIEIPYPKRVVIQETNQKNLYTKHKE